MNEKTLKLKKEKGTMLINCNLELQLLTEIHSTLEDILEQLKKGKE